MKTTLAACCAVFATGLTLAAQTPAPQPPEQPQPRPKADRPMGATDSARTTTVTGCISTWDAAMAAKASGSDTTAGAAKGASSTATAKYVLTNVTHDAMSKTDSASSKQNPYGSAAASHAPTLALEAKDTKVDFAAHLNHKVQLTGTLDAKGDGQPQQSSTGTSGSTGTATTGRSTNAMPMTVPTFNVTALTMVAASCS